MAIFAISDLHLSFNGNKPMDVFGSRWEKYEERMQENWNKVVTNDDLVVIPGDISWGIDLEEAKEDLLFLDSLPGRKLIGKGNHDYFWGTVNKMTAFIDHAGITTISFLYNRKRHPYRMSVFPRSKPIPK